MVAVRANRVACAILVLALTGCTTPLNYEVSRDPDSLARDPSAPMLALLEHDIYRLLQQTEQPISYCAARRLEDGSLASLPDGDERRLLDRFAELAPFERCQMVAGRYYDALTGRTATIVEAFDLSCKTATRCTAKGGIRIDSLPYAHTEYELTFDGYWRVEVVDLGIVLT